MGIGLVKGVMYGWGGYIGILVEGGGEIVVVWWEFEGVFGMGIGGG